MIVRLFLVMLKRSKKRLRWLRNRKNRNLGMSIITFWFYCGITLAFLTPAYMLDGDLRIKAMLIAAPICAIAIITFETIEKGRRNGRLKNKDGTKDTRYKG